MSKRVRVMDLSRFSDLANQISGPDAFSLNALLLSSTFVTLNRISVIAFKVADPFIYVTSAAILSQLFALVFLFLSGRPILRVTNLAFRTGLVVTLYFVSAILANIILKLLLQAWGIEQITPPQWQIVINLIFITLIFLGISWVVNFISANLNQVTIASEIVDELFRERKRLIQAINDGRSFSGREISLEVAASRTAAELFETKYELAEADFAALETLKFSLSKVEVSARDSTASIPNRVSQAKHFSGKSNSLDFILDGVNKENSYLPISMAAISLFGLISWLGYFVDTRSIVLWGSVLCLIGYAIFWIYIKLVAPKLLRLSLVFRVICFELLLITYLFFWLLLLGFIAGDSSSSYSTALVNAIIPFLLFNGASVTGGILHSTQIHRAELQMQALELRISLKELEALRALEENIWKSLFAGDIGHSPTTASVMLQDLTVTGNGQKLSEVLSSVIAIWKSVETKLRAAID